MASKAKRSRGSAGGARLTRQISYPTGHFAVIVAFIVLIAVGAFLQQEQLLRFFKANALINGLIVGITVLGAVYLLLQVRSLWREIRWFRFAAHVLNEPAQHSMEELARTRKPMLLAPLDGVVRDSLDESKDFYLSASSYSAVVDGVSGRIDERRDVSRYMVGVLVFLGLLGTFWGLLGTVEGIASAVSNLGAGDEADKLSFFTSLSDRLRQPLSGMSTAFSSSLFGLAGSLILGFVELIAAQAHTRFANDMEDALAELTQLASPEFGTASGGGTDAVSLSETNATLDRLVKTMQKSENSRLVMDGNLDEFIRRLGEVQHDHATLERLTQMIAQLQELAYPVIVDTQSNLSKLVNSNELADLNKRLEYLARVLEQSSGPGSPEFMDRLDRIMIALEQNAGTPSGGSGEQMHDIAKQIQALRQELSDGRQTLGQQLLTLTSKVGR